MNEYEHEDIRGLPGALPPGETLLWQGSPDWRRLARDAFHVRLVAVYFAVLLAWASADAVSGSATSPLGIVTTAVLGTVCIGLLYGLALLSAKTTVYSITSKRVVLRFGMALPKCINLPFKQIAAARLAANSDGSGNIALAMTERGLGYLVLWPHARAWRLKSPEPMLRALPDVATVAALLADACAQVMPVRGETAAAAPGFGEALAA